MSEESDADAYTAINSLANTCKKLEGYKTEFLPLLASRLLAHIKQTSSAGTAPDGTQWPATKKGARALPSAAEKVDVSIVGSTIVMTVQGHAARHNYGQVRGGVVRRVIFSGRDDASVFTPIIQRTINEWLAKDGTFG